MIMLLVYVFPPKKLLTLTVKVNNTVKPEQYNKLKSLLQVIVGKSVALDPAAHGVMNATRKVDQSILKLKEKRMWPSKVDSEGVLRSGQTEGFFSYHSKMPSSFSLE